MNSLTRISLINGAAFVHIYLQTSWQYWMISEFHWTQSKQLQYLRHLVIEFIFNKYFPAFFFETLTMCVEIERTNYSKTIEKYNSVIELKMLPFRAHLSLSAVSKKKSTRIQYFVKNNWLMTWHRNRYNALRTHGMLYWMGCNNYNHRFPRGMSKWFSIDPRIYSQKLSQVGLWHFRVGPASTILTPPWISVNWNFSTGKM